MMFTVYGPGVTNPVPLEKLFVRPAVVKTAAVAPKQAIKAGTDTGSPSSSAYRSAVAKQRYQVAESVSKRPPTLNAEQIMTVPVIYVQATATVAETLKVLGSGGFRHLPVLSAEQRLVGMISDRDIVSCMCNSGSVCVHCAKDKQDISVEAIMKGNVLSASVETDARHIARLFVEQRIGAMPITENGVLVGMITRSDILRAVMVHFDLNLWS